MYEKAFTFESSAFTIFFCLNSLTSILFVSFILSSHSDLSFLSFCLVCAVSVSGLLWRQHWQNNKASGRTQAWCTLYSINSAHSKHFHTHTHRKNEKLSHTHTLNPLLTDLTPPSAQTVWTSLYSASAWQYFLQVSSQSRSLRRPSLIPKPLRKHKEKMISFQLGWAQGNFPAVFTHSERPDVIVHMWGAEESSSGSDFVVDVHEQRWRFGFFCFSILSFPAMLLFFFFWKLELSRKRG